MVYGLFYVFDGHFDFVVPYPLITLFVPVLCLIFFGMSIKHGGSIFFIFFPLVAIEALLASYFQADYSWLGYLTLVSAIVFIASNLKAIKSWENYKWIPITTFFSLVATILVYLWQPQQIIYPLAALFALSLFTVVLNKKAFDLPSTIKRQYLIICFTGGLLMTTLVSILLT